MLMNSATKYVQGSIRVLQDLLGGNVVNFKIPLMVSKELPIHKYSSGPQNYNPVYDMILQLRLRVSGLHLSEGSQYEIALVARG